MIAALNNIVVKAEDVLNTYVTASNREKIWKVLGQEFGDNAGKFAIIVLVYVGWKVLLHISEHILHSACSSQGMNLVRQTLTCGINLWKNTE